jgi:hypothetical protein
MMIRRLFLAAAAALTLALPAHAHDAKPMHGGKVVDAADHHLELVAKDGTLTLYVRNEQDKPEAVKDAKATATVLSGGKQEVVTLTPGTDSLSGKGALPIAKGTRVVVSLTMPGRKAVQARFSPAD